MVLSELKCATALAKWLIYMLQPASQTCTNCFILIWMWIYTCEIVKRLTFWNCIIYFTLFNIKQSKTEPCWDKPSWIFRFFLALQNPVVCWLDPVVCWLDRFISASYSRVHDWCINSKSPADRCLWLSTDTTTVYGVKVVCNVLLWRPGHRHLAAFVIVVWQHEAGRLQWLQDNCHFHTAV